MSTPTHYQVLALQQSYLTSTAAPEESARLVRSAYRRALLRHHPDKTTSQSANSISSGHRSNSNPYTIDEITTAYETLSDPVKRAAYNRDLSLLSPTSSLGCGGSCACSTRQGDFQTGIETVDLDDLSYADTPGKERWFRSCRCGNPQGFSFGEEDLEQAMEEQNGITGVRSTGTEDGELLVGCSDCSLWLRVHFTDVGDDEAAKG